MNNEQNTCGESAKQHYDFRDKFCGTVRYATNRLNIFAGPMAVIKVNDQYHGESSDRIESAPVTLAEYIDDSMQRRIAHEADILAQKHRNYYNRSKL